MTARPQHRGPRFERQVADYIKEQGFPFADRRVKTGAKDKGDIGGVPGWVLECKAPGPGKPLNLAQAMNEAEVEAANDGAEWFAAVVNRAGKNVSESYVVLPLRLWCRLAQRAPGTMALEESGAA